jgi:hypothetical protein
VPVDPEEVLPASNLQFPQPLPDTIALQEQVNQLQAELQSARTLSYLGGGLGLLGIVLGWLGCCGGVLVDEKLGKKRPFPHNRP